MGAKKTCYKGIFLTITVLLCFLWQAQAQNVATVKVSADPDIICAGESSNLHAYCEIPSDALIYDFETGMEGWTTIDADGHGNAWSRQASGGYNGSYCMRATYNYDFAHLDYLVSPQITLGVGNLSFYAKRESSSYNDTFRVYLSTTGNGVSDFTIELTNGDVTPSTSYTKYSYDLSSYQGVGYVAIVYTAPANQFYLYIDYITFYEEESTQVGTVYDFENHTLQGWTTIDADGDGYKWMLGSTLMPYGFTGHGGSSDIVVSQSYVGNSSNGFPLFPDNYLVSPTKISVQSGAFISFWACAQDATWAAEHFGVAVSTTGKTNPNDFTTIQEWTMTAKSVGRSAEVSRGGNRTMGAWYKYTVDLSAYVGQSIWVALRHFNVTDMFYLDVDDITLYAGTSTTSGEVTYEWNNGQSGQDITVLPSTTTTYMVTVRKNGNIIARGRKIVVVRPSTPTVTVTTDNGGTSICVGDELTITANTPEPPVFFVPGDILCADGSVVKRADWNNSMTAKGVVFYVDATGQHGWAIDLGQITAKKKWSTENVPVAGLQKYSLWYDAIGEFDGMANTMIIRNFGTSTKYPAAYAVDVDDGWYLPTAGQLNVLFGELVAVNSSLTLVGGSNAIIKTGSSDEIWSSNVCTLNDLAMTLLPNNGRIGYLSKSSTRYVRQVRDF